MPDRSILLIGEERLMAEVRDALREAGYSVVVAPTVAKALERLSTHRFDGTVLSLSTDTADIAFARRLVEDGRAGEVVPTAATRTFELAVRAREAGLARVLREPPSPQELIDELAARADEGEGVRLPGVEEETGDGPLLIGSTPEMEDAFHLVARVADSSATVLVGGESGTGKELVARAIHWASPRRGRPFVPVNCAAIPEHLLEAELFGHERGAFTGAETRKIGRFERASGGTLFLDEIGDMSLVLQAKILRALEEGEIERLGGESPLAVDVRIVAATNRSLEEAMREGEFREDLYYRLSVVRVTLPPLRERPDDLEPLALHFAAAFARRYDRPVRAISREALRHLRHHSWPGNVRELRNVMDRAVLVCRGGTIRADDLELGPHSPRLSPREAEEAGGYPPSASLAEVESGHIRRVLEYTDGHMSEAAEILGIHRNTLTRKVSAYGISVPGRAEGE